ncbi:CGNR zinc finger domain-containing protein [Phytomonospora sp. NPDC050363]|uniref:CGNR zinc finger domain-containing protein n=1 Tax=Phytomonospora sp. NPDC050363 TaxID=3155642 RepID=UPI0034011828
MAALPDIAISRIGGDLAVDFLNTVDWRFDPSRRNERLPDYPHMLAWMKGAGLLPHEQAKALAEQAAERPELAETEHTLVVELRDDTYDALNEGGSPAVLQDRLLDAHAAGRLDREPGGSWRWVPAALDLAAPRHLLAWEFARLLTSDEVVRFHRCEDRDCGWVFLDTSRQHNRRWCSAADCGNRNRVRAHYERSKSA